jgi:hypothetical protein
VTITSVKGAGQHLLPKNFHTTFRFGKAISYG